MSEHERFRLFLPPIRVKLTRLSRGTYRWEIESGGDTADDVLKTLDYLDRELRRRYAPGSVESKSVMVEAPRVSVSDVIGELSKDLLEQVDVADAGDRIIVSPKQFLGSDVFAKISRIVEGFGGQYVSDGKSSRWVIPKK